MNIAFFLTPKSELMTIEEHMTIRQALETMEYHRYTQVCVLDRHGKYIDALSEGDFLWYLKHKDGLVFKDTEKETVEKIPSYRTTKSVSIDSDIESLIELAASQSFVPVVDDQNVFIGIIKRSDILNYCIKKIGFKGPSNRSAYISMDADSSLS
ncbi:MAG: CBS domain-containing protein [Vallitaleaceae bacterium]|nr:CBS domain-containing protein [Vallitaleaceae bacterium]